MSTSRVFVTQQPKPNGTGWTPNLSPATHYGTIHFVFSGSDNPSTDPDGAIFQAADALKDFDPEKDYLLWPNGVDPFSIWASLIVLMRQNIPVLRGLTWNRGLTEGKRDRHRGYYTPVVFRLASFAEYPCSINNQSKENNSWQVQHKSKRSNRQPQSQSLPPTVLTSQVVASQPAA